MEHEFYKELLQLSVYDELGHKENELLENHLFECPECAAEYEQLKMFYTKVNSTSRPAPSDLALLKARNELFGKIESESRKKTFTAKLGDVLAGIFTGGMKYYAPAIATLFLGFFMGYIYFFNNSPVIPLADKSTDVDNKTKGAAEISNIRFKDPFTDDGQIEITYDAVMPITYKGGLEDEKVRELLARALVTSSNPGFKIKTLNTMSLQNEKVFIPDARVKSALITTVKSDENPGVRREALNLLVKFPYDEEILDLLIHTLAKDDNSGLRVAAINFLADYLPEGKSIDYELKKRLTDQVEEEKNDFIKLRAASLFKEVK